MRHSVQVKERTERGALDELPRLTLQKSVSRYLPDYDNNENFPIDYTTWAIRFLIDETGILKDMSLSDRAEVHTILQEVFDTPLQQPDRPDIVDPYWYQSFPDSDRRYQDRRDEAFRTKMELVVSRIREFVGRMDPLTKIKNQGAIEGCLRDVLKEISDGVLKSKMHIIMIDVDGLKKANDNNGHELGDKILVSLGKILRRSEMRLVRARKASGAKDDYTEEKRGIAGRKGGDEFALILKDVDLSHAIRIADRIRRQFNKKNVLNGATLSIGVSSLTSSNNLADVDRALYVSKKGTLNGGALENHVLVSRFVSEEDSSCKNRVTFVIPNGEKTYYVPLPSLKKKNGEENIDLQTIIENVKSGSLETQ